MVFSLSVILFTGLLYLVLYSGVFNVQSIEVQGAELYNEDFLKGALVREAVVKEKILGFLGSDNRLFWLLGDFDDVSNLPAIEEVSLTASIVETTVTVKVKEKEMFGIFCKTEDGCFAFDDEGFLFSKAPYVSGSLILRIDDKDKKPVVLGNRFLPENWTNNIFKTVEELKKSGFIPVFLETRAEPLREWSVYLPSGLEIQFDLSFVPKDFTETLGHIQEKENFNKLNYIDLRVPGRVYYK